MEYEQLSEIVSQIFKEQDFDLAIVGRETFANHAPDLLADRKIPFVQWVRGNPAIAMINGTFPEDQTAKLLQKFSRASLIITAAHHLTKGLREMGLSQVITIDNAIDLNSFRPGPRDTGLMQQLEIDRKDCVVLLPVNLHPRKRPLDLVESAKWALREEPGLVFLCLGDGLLRQPMEESCRERNISHRFRFLGWADYSKMPSYFRLAELVVVPSQSEGLARVYMETLASRRLLICSDIPASREAVANRVTALLYPTGDTAKLTSLLLQAARNSTLRRRIAARGYHHSRTFDLKRAVSEYEGAFERLLALRVG
jgi:glycosyltransferase involved in cell wall biosynthesis